VTLANRITLARVFCIPVFCALVYLYSPEREWLRWAAFALYTAAALSDILDGFIARRYHQHSRLGMRLDPLADKLIVNLGFVFIAANPYFYDVLPRWFMAFPVIVLSRDVFIVVGALLITSQMGPTQFRQRALGKATTWAHMSVIIAVLLKLSLAYYLILIALICTIASFADYFYSGAQLAASRKAA